LRPEHSEINTPARIAELLRKSTVLLALASTEC